MLFGLGLTGLVACGDNLQGNREPEATDSNVTTPEDTPVSITVNVTDPDGNALTFDFGSPEHGTITTEGGTVTYRPDDDYSGPDAIHVDISDGTYDATAEITITVTPVNDGPTAVDDALAANEDAATTVTGTALATNDIDIEDDALTVTAVGTPSTGTVGMVGDTITFTPPSNFTGTATFEYTVSDGALDDTGVVTVTVGGINDPPVAVADALTTAEDTAGTITAATLVANDTDAENQTLSVTGVSNFTNGTAALAGGTVTFTPAANFNGTAGFDYTVSDGGATATGHVTVTVTPVNDTPVANAQSVTVAEDGNVTITLTGSDIENTNLTFAIATAPTAGSLGTITPVNGTSATVVYTPNANSTAADSFTFTVNDTAATSTAATVSITVTPGNDPPVANATSATVNEDGSVVINLSGSDIDGDSLTFATVTGPATGTLSTYTLVPPTGATVTYTPNANSAASDSFTFRVNDGTVNSAPATVTITVTAQQDAPVANATTATTDEDTAVQITVTGSDIDGDALTFATGTGPAHGTLSAYTQLTPTSARATYTPAGNYNGPDAFTFTVNDGTATSAAATVGITVNAIDDAPVAMAGLATVAEDGNVTITLIGSDPESQPLTFSVVTGPTRGSLGPIGPPTATTADVVYTPNPNNDQNDSFTFRVTAGGVDSAPATVTITVTPSNDAPVANNDTDSTLRDTPVTRGAVFYTGNDTDVDGPSISLSGVSNFTNGTASLDVGAQTITFTPSAGFSGTAGYDYTITDGSLPATAHVTVTVISNNTIPVATDDTDSTNEDVALVVNGATYTADDIDPDPQTLTITSVLNPSNGSVSIDVGTQIITFTPTANYNGAAGFDYVVSDGIDTAIGHVAVTVDLVDDLPVASNDTASVNEDGGTVNTNVLANDSALGDGGLVVTVTTPATNGTATAQPNNTVTYAPNANFAGSDTYAYTVTDADGDPATAVVTVTVNPTNDAPVAQGQNQTMNENTVLTVTLTGTDIDVPGQQLTFAIVTPPDHGSLGTINSSGLTTATVTYTPAASYVGADSFTFTASDGTATSAAATVNITVNNVVVCNDGLVELPETCDDQGNAPGDGCSPTCQEETGWDCIGAPSACDPICNDGILIAGEEECDDGNATNTDGCTTQCQTGAVCTVATFAGGDRFATDPATGHCYVSFDTEQTTFADAQTACVTTTGHLASITSASEQTVAASVQNPLENPWIGLTDELAEGSFGWITTETLGYTNWASTPIQQPDGGEPEDCVNFFSTALGGPGTWNDTACGFIGFTAGRICEIETNPCGNGTVNAGAGEACDDGNSNNFDGCSKTCQVEAGAVCSGTAPTTCAKLVINEIDYDQPGADNTEFIEIVNMGTANADLTNIALILMNNSSSPGTEYWFDSLTGAGGIAKRIRLNAAGVPGNALPPGGIIVVTSTGLGALPAGVFRMNFTVPSGGLFQNGATSPVTPDSIGLFNVATNTMVDSLLYEGASGTGNIFNATGGPFTFNEGAGHPTGDPAPAGATFESLQRFPNGRDTQNNATDFTLRTSTPGLAN
ncbi:MAG TPA: Ig-like domain-containing protein [Kofleriaceae bacterium]|nr:Ig-like domain-containing protein [Kofleriaceae bacterium]